MEAYQYTSLLLLAYTLASACALFCCCVCLSMHRTPTIAPAIKSAVLVHVVTGVIATYDVP
jgi:hypothetical protein